MRILFLVAVLIEVVIFIVAKNWGNLGRLMRAVRLRMGKRNYYERQFQLENQSVLFRGKCCDSDFTSQQRGITAV